MPSKALDANGLQFAWSATTIKWAETCLRYYQYAMIEGWHSRGSSVHLRFGGHYATAIEHFFKHRASGMEFEDALRAVVREALIETWDYDWTVPEGYEYVSGSGRPTIVDDNWPDGFVSERIPGTGKPWTSDHNTKTRANLIRTIVWYFEQFRDEPLLPLTLGDNVPAVELSFALPVDNDIVFVGHLDRAAEFAGHPYIVDEKTTGTTLSPYYFEQFSPDTQMSLYTFIGKAAFNIPVKGVIIDAAQIAVGFSRFERSPTMRTEGQLNEWYDSTMDVIERARQATRNNRFPMNTSACGNYGGCPFRTVCSRDPAARQQFLKADFEKGGGYDPLERR